MASWSIDDFSGPNGEDWRVPTSEIEARVNQLSISLAEANIEAALIQNPVDLYYYAGGRQNGALLVPAADSTASIDQGGDGATFYVRRSISRAKFEAGGDDSPINIEQFPSLRNLADSLSSRGIMRAPSLQFGEIPADFCQKFVSVLTPLGEVGDCTQIIHRQR